MKKVILGIVIGLLFTPLTVLAVVNEQAPWAKSIINIPGESNVVNVFDDQDNKCYVARGGNWNGSSSSNVAISCVKR